MVASVASKVEVDDSAVAAAGSVEEAWTSAVQEEHVYLTSYIYTGRSLHRPLPHPEMEGGLAAVVVRPLEHPSTHD